MANSRAKAIDDAEGFVKILADDKTDSIRSVFNRPWELIVEIGIGSLSKFR